MENQPATYAQACQRPHERDDSYQAPNGPPGWQNRGPVRPGEVATPRAQPCSQQDASGGQMQRSQTRDTSVQQHQRPQRWQNQQETAGHEEFPGPSPQTNSRNPQRSQAQGTSVQQHQRPHGRANSYQAPNGPPRWQNQEEPAGHEEFPGPSPQTNSRNPQRSQAQGTSVQQHQRPHGRANSYQASNGPPRWQNQEEPAGHEEFPGPSPQTNSRNPQRSQAQGTSVQQHQRPHGRANSYQAPNGPPRWQNQEEPAGHEEFPGPSPQTNSRNPQRSQAQGTSVQQHQRPHGRANSYQAPNGPPRWQNQEEPAGHEEFPGPSPQTNSRNPQRSQAQGTYEREFRRSRGRGNSHRRPQRRVNQELGEGEQLVEDLMLQLEESNSENEHLRAELERRGPEKTFQEIHVKLREQIHLNETLEQDLKSTQAELAEATQAYSEVLQQISQQHDTASGLQTQLESVSEENNGTGQENGLPVLQSTPTQQISNNASLESDTKNLQAKLDDLEALLKDKDCRLNETRQELQERIDQLETEKEQKNSLREDVALMEEQLYKLQIQRDRKERELVQRLQMAQNEHQQTVTTLQKQEVIFKTEMQTQLDKNENLEARLKLVYQTFEKKRCELEAALRNTQDQLRKVEGEFMMTDASAMTEKERDSLQKRLLEMKREDAEKMQRDVALKEEQLYKMQTQKDNQEKLVQSLQKTLSERQQTITDLQNQELRSKTEMQAEQNRNRNLEDRVKTLNRILEKTECDQEAALRKARDQLKKVEGEYKAYATQMEKRLKDADAMVEKERDCLLEAHQLQIERDGANKVRGDVALKEEQLYQMQTQKEIQEKLVQSLQKTLHERQQTITDLQKQELRFKTEMQAEQNRSRHLEEKLKLLNQTFEKKQCEMELSLRKAQEQLKKVEGEYKANATQMGKRLTDANAMIEKERNCLQKERQANVQLKEQIRRNGTEAESYNDKVRDFEAALKQEAQSRKQLQAKVAALEKALEEQRGAVRDLKALLKSERDKFKDFANNYSSQIKTVVMERNELSRTVAGQQQTMESDKNQMKELTEALATEQATSRALQQEKEVLLQHMEKKRRSKWKFWQRI